MPFVIFQINIWICFTTSPTYAYFSLITQRRQLKLLNSVLLSYFMIHAVQLLNRTPILFLLQLEISQQVLIIFLIESISLLLKHKFFHLIWQKATYQNIFIWRNIYFVISSIFSLKLPLFLPLTLNSKFFESAYNFLLFFHKSLFFLSTSYQLKAKKPTCGLISQVIRKREMSIP